MKIEIIICTENGYLEAQSKLLVYSIRKFGGILKNVEIFSYKPRKGKALDQSTITFFEKNNVNYIDLELNEKYANYPFANKPLVCSHRENASSADVLIFLDSDTFFLRSPEFIQDINSEELHMRPVDYKYIGSDKSFSGVNGQYWKKLYSELGVSEYKTVHTTVDNREILEYFNAGMIVSSISNSLFQNWKYNFEKIMSLNLKPRHGIYFVEQSVLSATISAMNLNVKTLPKEYNYPLGSFHRSKNSSYSVDRFTDLGHVHYHKLFINPKGINPYFKEFKKFNAGRIIHEKLDEFGVLKTQNVNFGLKVKRRILSIKSKWLLSNK